MSSTVLLVATALAAQAPAAQEPAPQPGAAPAQTRADAPQTEDRMVCKRVSSPGTRFKERKCAKASEWAKQERHYVETTRELKQTRGSFKGG